MKVNTKALLGLGLFQPTLVAPSASPTASVTIKNGTVVGIDDQVNNVRRFLGIPYAQPPAGDLRLAQAVPLAASFGSLDASSFGHSCFPGGVGTQPNSAEDCLTLNIWRPYSSADQLVPEDKLPVLVWLYGGGLANGYAANPLFEATNLARISREISKPVVVVSLNYRLGALGFLSGRQMQELGLVNLGMQDQRLAFRWVRENIAAFGGDPKKVTLFGQSAGAVSIYSHLMAFGGRDDKLFRGAIMQSGGAFPLSPANSSAFQAVFDSIIKSTPCVSTAAAAANDQVSCLRNLPLDVFRNASAAAGGPTGQSIDGDFTQRSIQFALAEGKYNKKVAVLVGTNTDEGTAQAPTGVETTQQLRGPLSTAYGRPVPLPDPMIDALLSLYSTDPRQGCPYNTGLTRLSSGVLDKYACALFGDVGQIGPARMMARSMVATNGGTTPVYRYRFNQLGHDAAAVGPRGVGTGAEQSFVFGNSVSNWTYDQTLSYEMSSAWVSFAHDLNPNPGGGSSLPFWPQYGKNATSIVFNSQGSYIETDTYRDKAIDYIIDNVLKFGVQ